MTVTINGTTGITNDGGYTGDGVVFADTTPANTLVTTTGGKVGVGTASPSTVARASFGNSSAGGQNLWAAYFATNSDTASTAPNFGLTIGWNRSGGGGESNIVYGTGLGSTPALAFSSSDGTTVTERARIDASGNLLVGNNDNLSGKPPGVICPIGYVGRAGISGASANVFNIFWSGSNAQLWIDTTNIGNIQVSSDYRIKKNVETQTAPAIDRVMRLRPVTYEIADYGDLFKADGVQREGFIAHEVQEVIPSGAEGYKDEEGRVQNLRTDAILSVAVKAIQEQQAIITALTARVAALEGTQP